MRTAPEPERRGGGRTILGRPLPSRSAVTSALVVLVLSTVPVVVPLLVIRNDDTRSLTETRRESGRVPDTGTAVGLEPTWTDPGSPTPAPSTAGPASPTSAPAPPSAAPATGAHPATRGGRGPDLVVLSVSWSPAQPRTGDVMRFSAVVRNIGTDPSPNITHGIGFLVDGRTVMWSGGDSAPLGPGQQRTYIADESDSGPPEWVATRGGHELTAWADDINRFPEADERNNTRSVQFAVT